MHAPARKPADLPFAARAEPRGVIHSPAQQPAALRVAFGIVSLFPGGGLQRNCLAIAQLVRKRGHEVVIFTSRTAGPLPGDLPIAHLPNRRLTNHGRNLQFAADLANATNGRFDLVVGFDKLSGVDVVYCADPSIAARTGWRSLTPRHRVLRALEASCFARTATTRIIALSPAQIDAYRRAWDTEHERIALLPPNVDPARRHPERRLDGTRETRRAALALEADDWCWLAIGRQPHHKGFDRAIAALPEFPTARLFIIGIEPSEKSGVGLRKSARRLGVEDRVTLLGFVPDDAVLDTMAAADLLLHPARFDTTGTVILEAIVNGLPVVTTAICGYASHVREAEAGAVVPEPFDRMALSAALTEAADRTRAAVWSANGTQYGERPELYSGLEVAADLILRAAGN